MRAGLNPFHDGADLTDAAVAVAEARAGEFREYSDAWAAEIMRDPVVREWAAGLFPADVLLDGELARRPSGIAGGDGPHRCAGCGIIGVGRFVYVVDRLGFLGGDSGALRWCQGCVLGALGAGT